MKSILKQLIDGDMIHLDYIKHNEETEKLLDDAVKYDEEIREKLKVSSELSELYEKTNYAVQDYHDEISMTNYEEGFKLGFRFCLEILQNDK